MKGEKETGTSKRALGSSTMSEFLRHGAVEEKRAVYHIAAIDEQKDLIRSVKAGEYSAAKCK